ncbi:MAG: DUF1178 family protein [Marinovum sp.]|nr:DUF1178 family protein [Marinovum sp.]
MIRYALKCAENHRFESWFKSATAYDALATAGHINCPICGSTEVTKDIMTPRVAAKSNKAEETAPLTKPKSKEEQALAAFKAHVEENATYVGGSFAQKAREIHSGDAPEGAIYGEAKPEEAKALIEDGIPVAPLPFRPTSKNN